MQALGQQVSHESHYVLQISTTGRAFRTAMVNRHRAHCHRVSLTRGGVSRYSDDSSPP